ncbi:Transferase [Arabidopsis suecica]|uniref:Transferase n=1 Tax=Arabidopsis suecica TaxID=45249 RepID=A0A8T1ZW75_ARASU|nr:Transferase [Arabidopsis suecica]
MEDVTVISKSIVQPGNISHSGQTKIHLTPSDLSLLYLDYPQRALIFPKPDPETRFISRLKSSLSVALEIYFPLAGRLVKVNNHEDNTVSLYIDCDDGRGVTFVHAIAESVSVSDIIHPHGFVPEYFRLFFPVNGVRSIDGLLEPLLALQVTEIKDGIVFSFGYNHLVADGSSMWKFIHVWSKICMNGEWENHHQPLVLRRWFLDMINFPIHIPVSEIETERVKNREISTKERVFHFTKEKISELKAKANGEIGSSDIKISSLQAVLAHLWRSIVRHSGLNREEESHCGVAADFRQRINPPLDKDCFGNVANLGMATATVGDLVDRGLGWAALQINKTVRSQTNENFRTFAENWVRNGKIPRIDVRSKRGDHVFIVTNSPRFEVYDNDFGLGKPIAVRAGPANGIGGKLVVFRGIEEGSIDVHAILTLSLWSDMLLNLFDDVKSMENVTIT